MPLPNTSETLHRDLADLGRRCVVLLLSSTLITGCVSANRGSPASAAVGAGLACEPGANRWVRSELYFGLSKPDGSLIAEEDFRRFLDSEVTPRFRSGFTVLDGRGQFLSETGTLVRESSKLLVLLYPSDQRTSVSVEEIRRAYRTQFQQESVLRVDAAECVSFEDRVPASQ